MKLSISFKGGADAPTTVQIKTVEPIAACIEAHSVKPRYVAGKCLQGTLEKISKKFNDKVQLSFDFTATPKKP